MTAADSAQQAGRESGCGMHGRKDGMLAALGLPWTAGRRQVTLERSAAAKTGCSQFSGCSQQQADGGSAPRSGAEQTAAVPC